MSPAGSSRGFAPAFVGFGGRFPGGAWRRQLHQRIQWVIRDNAITGARRPHVLWVNPGKSQREGRAPAWRAASVAPFFSMMSNFRVRPRAAKWAPPKKGRGERRRPRGIASTLLIIHRRDKACEKSLAEKLQKRFDQALSDAIVIPSSAGCEGKGDVMSKFLVASLGLLAGVNRRIDAHSAQ